MRDNFLRHLLVVLVVTLSPGYIVFYAQTDTWVPANPMFVVPNQLSVSNCNGRATVTASWLFNSGDIVSLYHQLSRVAAKRFHSIHE